MMTMGESMAQEINFDIEHSVVKAQQWF